MAIKLITARGSKRTAALLRELLEERGVKLSVGKAEAVVSYGVNLGATKLPALNANAGGITKLEELKRLSKAGVAVPQVFEAKGAGWLEKVWAARPVLARRLHHQGGTDVRYTSSKEWLRKRAASRWAYFTKFIPSDAEYRTWVYRGRHLCTYKKVLAHPERRKNLYTRNHKNGYAFTLVKEGAIPRDAVALAVRGIAALDLDFGAVDIIRGVDGKCYVLEVNTAPGVDGERVSSSKLADKIASWVRLGYPKRKGA